MPPIVDTPSADARRVFGPRRRVLVALVVGVVSLHALLLAAWHAQGRRASGPTEPPDRAAATVRVTALARPGAAPTSAPARKAGLPPAGLQAAEPPPDPDSVALLKTAAAAGSSTPAPLPDHRTAPKPPSPNPAGPSAPGPLPTPPQEGATAVPLYPTRLPPPTVRAYRLQQGLLAGEAEWRWQPAGASVGSAYEVQLLGRVGGLQLLDWRSQGTVDTAGVAPDRFVVRRRGRGAQATNFQREALAPDGRRGKISFSAATAELPLVPGAQDRLSWMVQLPAVIDADPVRWSVPGREIVLWVVGTRGDAEAWTFDVIGPEPVLLADGRTVPALKLVREPRRAYDTQAEVWLDPARHHLPLRARLRPTGKGEPLELLWLGEGGA